MIKASSPNDSIAPGELKLCIQSLIQYESILNYAVGTFVALFPIANPIGAVPVFYSLIGADSHSEHR